MQSRLLSSRFLATLALLLCVPASWGASAQSPSRLFVLESGSAQVFDPETLDLLGRADAPAGAFRVLGSPDADGGRAKFYLVGARSIAVLSEGFERLATIALPAPAIPATHGAAMSPDGRRLLVATRFGVLLISTDEDRLLGRLTPNFPTGGVALLSDATRALVFGQGVPMAREIDLTADVLTDRVVTLPAALETASLSADGARAFGLAGGAVYDLAELSALPTFHGATETLTSATDSGFEALVSGGARAALPAATPVERLTVTNTGRFYLASENGLLRGRIGADDSLRVLHPSAGTELELRRAVWAASADGARIYAAVQGERALYSFDPEEPRFAQSAALAAEAKVVELVIPRVRQAGSLEILTAEGLKAAGGTNFEIDVRIAEGSTGSIANVPVFPSSIMPLVPAVNCLPDVTDNQGQATIPCSVGAVSEPTPVEISIVDADGRAAPVFTVEALPPTADEGLVKIEGDGGRFPDDDDVVLVVQLSRNRLPAPGVNLAITVGQFDTDFLECPRTVLTDENGLGTVECFAPVLPEGQAATVDVTVSAGQDESVTFSISIDDNAAAPTGLSVISGNGQLVSQGASFSFRVASQRDGAPRSNVILNIIPNIEGRQEPLSICPTNAMTNEEGIATITCRAGVIFTEREVTRIQVADFGVRLPEAVEIFVTRSAPQGAGTLRIDSEESFNVIANEPLANAIQVTALTGNNGTPVPNTEVHFSSDQDVIFDPPVAFTNLEGQASTTVTIGCITTPSVDIDIGFSPGEEIVDVRAEVDAGRFSEIVKIAGDNQSGFPGQRLTSSALVARTQDACGNDSERIPVQWRVLPAFAATLGNLVDVSDGSGRVSALVTLGSYGGPFQVEVGNDQDRVVFDVAVNLPAEELRLRSGDSQVAGGGETLQQPLVVQALGITGFGVSGVPVQWQVIEGPGSIVSSRTTTDNAGVAFATVRLGLGSNPQQGTGPRVRVRASALGESVTFSINGDAKPIAPVEAFVNGASFQSGWVPGGLGTIFGQFLSNVDGIAAADQVPFPTNFEGVTVEIAGRPAPLISIVGIDGSEQINLQVPFETPVGDADVTINNNGVELVVNDVPINRVQPGVFEINVEGQRIAAALHQDFRLITPSDPAVPGEVVQLYFTGGGPLSPAVATNEPGPTNPIALTSVDVIVGVDGEGQESFGSFYAPGLVSANQVNFRLGADTPSGMRTLTLLMDGVPSQEVQIPVQ